MKSIVICGSQRFKEEIETFAKLLERKGVPVVFRPEFRDRTSEMANKPESERLMNDEYKLKVPGLVHAHLQRIRESDVCYVYNKNGYIGVNTTLEIGFAHGLNKIIYTLESESKFEEGGELCRQILFNKVIKDPNELYDKLR